MRWAQERFFNEGESGPGTLREQPLTYTRKRLRLTLRDPSAAEVCWPRSGKDDRSMRRGGDVHGGHDASIEAR